MTAPRRPHAGASRTPIPATPAAAALPAGKSPQATPTWPQRIAVSTRGMVATQHAEATRAGVAMLEAGGNAFDAAVAAAFALGVCEPAASGLGGQTMVLFHHAESRRTIALDGSSRAPNRATPELFRDPSVRHNGYTATTVPSTPAVLSYVLRKYGTKKLPRILEPSIHLAEEGFPVSDLLHRLTRREAKRLRSGPAAAFFLRDGQKAHPAGALLRQPVLAQTLRRLASGGVKEFYKGEMARQIQADMERNGGLLRRDDLAQVPRPIERRPLARHFEGMRVFTFPPPGAGRTLLEMLNILSHFPKRRRNPDSPEGAILLASVIRQAFLDRRDRPFDPSYYPQIDDRKTLGEQYAKRVAQRIRSILPGHGETTHLSVMDAKGNVVGLTQSIERVYGSGVASPELGFLWNNYMSAFEYEDISHPYYLRPNAAPWASVAPTIVMRGRTPWLVIGSPGSERITSSILQVLLRLGRQPPLDAVTAPRMHCALDGKVSLEASRMRDDVPRRLRRAGFSIDEREPFAFYLGCVQLVLHEGKELVGVADPRRDGAAGGPRR